MALIPTLAEHGNPGQIVDTQPYSIETVRYSATRLPQKYSLDVNPISGAITAYGNYTLNIAGSNTTMVFSPGVNPFLLDFTSQLAQHINTYGLYWASIAGSGLLTLTARSPGSFYPIALGAGLVGATLTQTQAPFSPVPLTPGTLVFWDPIYTSAPDDHRDILTYDVASVQAGFDPVAHIAGVVTRSPSNYDVNAPIVTDWLEIMRMGKIWVRNYGGAAVGRNTPILFNNVIGTPLLPSGAFGAGIALTGANLTRLQYNTYAAPQDTVELRILLP